MANTIIPEKLPIRPIIAITLGINAALLLADVEYWTPRANNSPAKGWVYKSQPDIFLETGLSRDQQDRCLPIIIDKFIEYRIAGGNVRHFRFKPQAVDSYEKDMRLNTTLLCELASRKCGRKPHTITIRVSNNKHGLNDIKRNYKYTPPSRTEIKERPMSAVALNDVSEPQSTKGYESAKQIIAKIKAKQRCQPP